MKPLEKIINGIRIAPHGVIPTTMAAGLVADHIFGFGFFENLKFGWQAVDFCSVSFIFLFNTKFIREGIKKYKYFREIIEEYGIDKRHVELNLPFYCERQAYKAAAYSCGLGKEFDEVKKNYKGEKYFRWIPGF